VGRRRVRWEVRTAVRWGGRRGSEAAEGNWGDGRGGRGEGRKDGKTEGGRKSGRTDRREDRRPPWEVADGPTIRAREGRVTPAALALVIWRTSAVRLSSSFRPSVLPSFRPSVLPSFRPSVLLSFRPSALPPFRPPVASFRRPIP